MLRVLCAAAALLTTVGCIDAPAEIDCATTWDVTLLTGPDLDERLLARIEEGQVSSFPHPAAGDVDGDGRQDLVFGIRRGALGVVHDISGPAPTSVVHEGAIASGFEDISLADLDADGDPDVTAHDFGDYGTSSIARNDDGVFAPTSGEAGDVAPTANLDGVPPLESVSFIGEGVGIVIKSWTLEGAAVLARLGEDLTGTRIAQAIVDLDGDGLDDVWTVWSLGDGTAAVRVIRGRADRELAIESFIVPESAELVGDVHQTPAGPVIFPRDSQRLRYHRINADGAVRAEDEVFVADPPPNATVVAFRDLSGDGLDDVLLRRSPLTGGSQLIFIEGGADGFVVRANRRYKLSTHRILDVDGDGLGEPVRIAPSCPDEVSP